MLWIKAFHIVSMVIWFSGLFYLPRLFVYHAMTEDEQAKARFILMEKKLYYYVTHPGAAFTLLFGLSLLYLNWDNDSHATWMQLKLGLVVFLLAYHFYLGSLLRSFKNNRNRHSDVFYRWVNEVPNIFLIGIIILVVVKPQAL